MNFCKSKNSHALFRFERAMAAYAVVPLNHLTHGTPLLLTLLYSNSSAQNVVLFKTWSAHPAGLFEVYSLGLSAPFDNSYSQKKMML